MKITKEWLTEQGACEDGIEWFCKQSEHDFRKLTRLLVKDGKSSWAWWLWVHHNKQDAVK